MNIFFLFLERFSHQLLDEASYYCSSLAVIEQMVRKGKVYLGVRGVWAVFLGVSQVRQIRSDRQVALGTLKAVGLG